jgi:hypothetical protein
MLSWLQTIGLSSSPRFRRRTSRLNNKPPVLLGDRVSQGLTVVIVGLASKEMSGALILTQLNGRYLVQSRWSVVGKVWKERRNLPGRRGRNMTSHARYGGADRWLNPSTPDATFKTRQEAVADLLGGVHQDASAS